MEREQIKKILEFIISQYEDMQKDKDKKTSTGFEYDDEIQCLLEKVACKIIEQEAICAIRRDSWWQKHLLRKKNNALLIQED